MPTVKDFTPRRPRRVKKDGKAFVLVGPQPFAAAQSQLVYAAAKEGYLSQAPASNRFITVTDRNPIQNLLYGSGFDTGNEFHSSFVSSTTGLATFSGNPFRAATNISPLTLGLRTVGFVGPTVGMNNPFIRFDNTDGKEGSALRAIGLNTSPPKGPVSVSDAALRSFGTVALSQTNPLKPPAQLLVAIGEILSDGLPPVLGKALLMAPKAKKPAMIAATAGEYLNYLFGYQPMVTEILNTMSAIKLMSVYVSNWQRNVDKETRRSFSANPSTSDWSWSTDVSMSSNFQLSAFSDDPSEASNTSLFSRYTAGVSLIQSNPRAKVISSGSYTRDMRFTGSFWYNADAISNTAIPEFMMDFITNGDKTKFNEELTKLQLLGLGEAAGSLAWQLTPFSWFIDWFVNLGDMISAVETQLSNDIQLRYGYVTSREVWKENLYSQISASTGSLSMISSVERVRMRRIQATPFGFGVTFNGLSDSQKLVMAALAAVFYGKA